MPIAAKTPKIIYSGKLYGASAEELYAVGFRIIGDQVVLPSEAVPRLEDISSRLG